MTTPRRLRAAIALAATAAGFVAFLATRSSTAVPPAAEPAPSWIWAKGETPEGQTVHFRKVVDVPSAARSARVVATCDNEIDLFIDGNPVLTGKEWSEPAAKDVTAAFAKPGRHVIAALGRNQGGPAGLLLKLTVTPRSGAPVIVVSDDTWATSGVADGDAWKTLEFNDEKWAKSVVVAELGGGPWSGINPATLASAGDPSKGPQAPAPESFKVAKGFKVERLYTVPKDEQGSWVNMTVDPKGRLIVSDQYGKLYRVTPPPAGGEGAAIRVESIPVPLGEAQGLLWAFDSLYVVVNRGEKYESGLYRVTDTNNDDMLDRVEKLRTLQGGGEHGPHGVVLSPDGKALYVVAGNDTKLTELAGSLVPRIYGEDQMLPYMTDGNGFMKYERAPGGCIYRVDPSGKDWTLVSMGYRNAYDLAFNHHGDLFTYDSDMEWDINTPWYRPTRVCQADSGSDLGYRNGSGKWPTYYPDSLPPTVNIGPGSPTGVTFGYGARFPAKYQDALYISDWSYGKLYAVHMTPEQSHYKAEVEEFITGQPLPLTDVVVNPKDHAMYFTIGGRRTLSGLYRVTYTGDESTETSKPADPGAAERDLRRSLEAFHGRKDPKAVDAAWPHLGHPDRFVRYAARVAIEWQDPSTWTARALAETDPQASLTALLAVTRAGEKSLQGDLLKALSRLDWDKLNAGRKLEALRVLQLAIIRMGKPDEDMTAKLVAKLDEIYPAKSRDQNTELAKLMIGLEAPSAARKTMALLAAAPTQEEQLEYAVDLRRLHTGWTPELRKAYFTWFLKAANFKGGASLAGFVRQIKDDAVTTLSPEEKTALKPILDAKPEPKTVAANVPARPFVKTWTVDELASDVENNLTKRDFDRGRALFGAAQCFACHRFADEGGAVGPDLTIVSGRFSPRDLFESIILPSKSVSDQYQAITVATTDGRVITGRVVNLAGDKMMINTNMLDPSATENVDRKQVEEIKPSTVSMMPEGLLNTLNKDEILDLVAYLLSRGDREHKMFR